MNRILGILILPLLSLVLICLGQSAIGQDADTSGQVYTWVEGGKERKVWLNPRLIAEFNPTPEPLAPGPGIRQARLVTGVGAAVRFWTLDEATTLGNGVAMMKSTNPAGSFSPVFHPRASGGAKMALPGSVIVSLDPSWSAAQVTAWTESYGLSVIKQFGFGKNHLLIASLPGIATLETTEYIRGLEGVVEAFPNWWVERSTR